jgi:hypothetical protein
LHLQRLRSRKEKDPQQFEVLFNIIDEEVSRNDHNHGKSCTKGLLWLKRWAQQAQHVPRIAMQLSDNAAKAQHYNL